MNTGIYPPGYNTPLGQYTTDYLQNAQQRRQWEERKAEAARKALPPEDPIDTIRKNFSSTMIEHIKWGELEQLLKNFKPEDINLRTKDGYSLLYVAIRYSFDLEAQTLIQNGANPAVIEANKQTSLHIATEKNFTLLAYKCLLKGAPKNHKDVHNLTPLDIAHRNQNADLIALFRLWPDSPLNTRPTPNVTVTGLQPVNGLPQQLQFTGNGSFLLQLDEQPIHPNWGVSTFPHLQATLIHPLQISEREFSTLLQNRRLVLVTSENGALKACCSAALKTTIAKVGNSVPVILRWHVRHPLSRTEHFLINLGNITPIDDLKTQNNFLEQLYRGLNPVQIIQRTTDHHLQFLNEKGSDYLPLARVVRPGDRVQGDFDRDVRGEIKFKFYTTDVGDIRLEFFNTYEVNNERIYGGNISSYTSITLEPKDPKSFTEFEATLRLVYTFAKGFILLHQGAFNSGIDEVHNGDESSRKVLNEAFFLKKPILDEGLTAKGIKQKDFGRDTARFGFYFSKHTDARRFYIPATQGSLNPYDEAMDTRFVYDDGEFIYPPNSHARQLIQLLETDRLLDAVSKKNEGLSLKADWIEAFQSQVKRLSTGSFGDSYISYCEIRLANRFDLIFGPEGYFDLFSKSSQLPRLCKRYNLPEQTGGSLKSLFSFNPGELDVLRDAIKKKEHQIVQSLLKVYEHLKERRVELESYVGILEAIAPQSRRLREFQEKLTLFHRRLQAIHDELKQAGLIKV